MKPRQTAKKGRRIYDDKWRDKLEREALHKFVVINIDTEEYYLGDTAEQAIDLAKAKAPQAKLHLMKVGQNGAYNLKAILSNEVDWRL